METAQCTWRAWYSLPVPADLSLVSYVIVSDRRHPATSRCHGYGLSLASVPFHTPDRQHGTLCWSAFAMNQTLQSFGNILKLTFFVQHLTFHCIIKGQCVYIMYGVNYTSRTLYVSIDFYHRARLEGLLYDAVSSFLWISCLFLHVASFPAEFSSYYTVAISFWHILLNYLRHTSGDFVWYVCIFRGW